MSIKRLSGTVPAGLLALTALFVGAGTTAAQTDWPRIGISAAPDRYVDRIVVESADEVFTLYACVLGPESGAPLDQPLSQMAWVIHQVCCGAEIAINDIQYNDQFEHTGHPLLGVRSRVEGCVDQDTILLATITASLNNGKAGDMLWAAGPFGPAVDCNGGAASLASLPLTIIYNGEPTPEESTTWGALKAIYR